MYHELLFKPIPFQFGASRKRVIETHTRKELFTISMQYSTTRIKLKKGLAHSSMYKVYAYVISKKPLEVKLKARERRRKLDLKEVNYV